MKDESYTMYRGYCIVPSQLPGYSDCFTVIIGYDYFQVPPFISREEAKRYIDAGGNGVIDEVVPGFPRRGTSFDRNEE